MRRNEFKSDVYIRPLLFTSSEEIGVRLHNISQSFLIYAIPFGNYVEIEAGLRCMVSSWRRVPDQSLPARAKVTGSYAQSALAKSEANEDGYDEAIVLTIDGHVSEGSAENLFMIKDGAFVTPPVTDDILEGITRTLIIKLIKDELGLPVIERSIDRTELYTCDELLLCGTGAQVAPVSRSIVEWSATVRSGSSRKSFRTSTSGRCGARRRSTRTGRSPSTECGPHGRGENHRRPEYLQRQHLRHTSRQGDRAWRA